MPPRSHRYRRLAADLQQRGNGVPAIVYALLMNDILLVYLKLLPKYSGRAVSDSPEQLYLHYENS